jgi:3alpha(or 20beta)-hydroxysteroid dehydrogenase
VEDPLRGIAGKVALVTGGRAAWARRGAPAGRGGRQGRLGDILDDEGKQLADELGDAARLRGWTSPTRTPGSRPSRRREREFGRVDVLVNNAGILTSASSADMPLDEYDRVVEVNQVGVFLGMKHAVPALERAGGGAIVNVSSSRGWAAGRFLTAYTASKFAVRGMTKAAAWELGRKNIRVNSSIPARSARHGLAQGLNEERREVHGGKTALKRMGEPEEVAAVMAFLASTTRRT